MSTASFGWKCVGATQALAWFVLVPPLLKPHWQQAWEGLSPMAAQVLLNELGFFYFFVYTLVMLPIYYGNFPIFEQYKISDKSWAWRSDKKEIRDAFWALSFRSMYLFSFNFGILVPTLTVAKYYLIGDVMSFSTDEWPTLSKIFIDNVFLTLVHEFGFYWSHRLAHHPKLYLYHKVHHEYKQNTVLASQHEHPIDYIVTIATPALFAITVVQPHSITLFLWIGWIVMANIDDHVGYEFPWSPVRWFWFAGMTDMHEFHHSKNIGCFASKLRIFDTIFDSEKPYLTWRSKREKAHGDAKGKAA